MSRDKLTQLWLSKRKKAIAIIRNNGIWPSKAMVTITTGCNEEYYKSSDKYVLQSSFHYNGDDGYFDKVNCEVTRDDYFK